MSKVVDGKVAFDAIMRQPKLVDADSSVCNKLYAQHFLSVPRKMRIKQEWYTYNVHSFLLLSNLISHLFNLSQIPQVTGYKSHSIRNSIATAYDDFVLRLLPEHFTNLLNSLPAILSFAREEENTSTRNSECFGDFETNSTGTTSD